MRILAEIFSTFFGALVIVKSYADFKRGKESLALVLFWTTTWIIIILIAYFPTLIDTINTKLGGDQKEGVNTVIGLSLTFVFFVMYRIYIKTDRVEKELNRLIREMATKENSEE